MISRKKLIYLLLIFSPFLLVLPLTIYFLRFPQGLKKKAAGEGVCTLSIEGSTVQNGVYKIPKGSKVNIVINQNPRCQGNGSCYYDKLAAKIGSDTLCEARFKSSQGDTNYTNPAKCLWDTIGKDLGQYTITTLYGGHSDACILQESTPHIDIPPCGKMVMSVPGANTCCCDCSGTCSLQVEIIPPVAATATPTQGLSTQPCHKVTMEGSNNFYCQGSCSSGKTCQQVDQDCQCISGQGGGGRCMVLDDYQDERHGICCPQTQCHNAAGQLKRLPGDSADINGCGTVSGQESIWCCSYCNGTAAPTPIGGYPTKRPEVQATSTPPPAGELTVTSSPTPSPEPTSDASIPYLVFRVKFEGFSDNNQPKMAVTLKVKNTDFSQTLIVTGGEQATAPIYLPDFIPGQTYEFLLSSWGYLSVKETLALNSGHSEHNQIDFGKLKVGDLNGDNQINGIDWSLMKVHFGESGEE